MKVLKFRYFEKATKFEKNLPLKLWCYWVASNFKWKILSNFVAFSEYPNFTVLICTVASDKNLLLPSCVFHIQISFLRLFAKFVAVMVYSMPNMSARSRHHRRKKKLMHFSYFALIGINDGILKGCILFSVLFTSCSIFRA